MEIYKVCPGLKAGSSESQIAEEYIFYSEDQGNNFATGILHHLAIFHLDEDPVERLHLRQKCKLNIKHNISKIIQIIYGNENYQQ